MLKYTMILLSLCVVFTTNASELSKKELLAKGAKAYENEDCLNAVKYLYAYLCLSTELKDDVRKEILGAIAFCEGRLKSDKNLGGLVGNRSVFSAGGTDGNRSVFSAGGALMPENLNNGGRLSIPGNGQTLYSNIGVPISPNEGIKTIKTTTRGVLMEPEPSIVYKSGNLEPFAHKEWGCQMNQFDFSVKKKQIELNAFGRMHNLNIEQDSFIGTPNSFIGTPNSFIGTPNSSFGTPNSSFGSPNSFIGTPNSSFGSPNSSFGTPNSSFGSNR